MEQSDKRDRRRIIEEVTKRWIKKNPETLSLFADNVKEMRQGRPYENQTHVYRATVPGDLFRQLDFALSSSDEPRAFNPPGELQWFAEQFPEFSIPYDRSTLER